MIRYKDKEYACPVELTLDLISGKWKWLILWYLQDETLRYGEIKKILGKITQKMLTQSLRELESHELISRKVYPVVPPKVEYTITERGKKLIPVLEMMQAWGVEVATELGQMPTCKLSKKEEAIKNT